MDPKPLSKRVAVGGQPRADDLAQLRDQGFTTVVNLRVTGEANQQLSPEDEGRAAASSGLAYHHVPVSTQDLRPEQVAEVRAAIQEAPGRVLVHCGAGQRACAIALLAEADGEPGGESLLERSREAGFAITDDNLKDFVMRVAGDNAKRSE